MVTIGQSDPPYRGEAFTRVSAVAKPERMLTRLHILTVAIIALGLAGCSAFESEPETAATFERPETAVDYQVELTGVDNERVRELMQQALSLFRLQDSGAQSLAFLRRRAEGDVATAQKILRSFGFYEAEVEVDVKGAGPVAANPDDAKAEKPQEQAVARIIVTENRQYRLTKHEIALEEPVDGQTTLNAADYAEHVGKPVRASRILSAEANVVNDLRTNGRPYATRTGRDAVADTDVAELEVTTQISPGRAYVYGDTTYEGAEGVERAYLDTYRHYEKGQQVAPADLVQLQRALISTGLFNAGSVNFPDEPPEGDVAPVLVSLEEAPPRTIGGGVRYDTDAGPAVRGEFQHRNLFGSNETLTLEALVGLNEQNLQTRYRLPQFGRPGQDLVAGLELRHIDDDAFEEFGGTLTLGLEREITPELTIGAGGLLELSQIEESNGDDTTSRLVGLPIFAAYDNSDDRLDPTEGFRARLSFTPFTGYVGDNAAAFAVLDGTLSGYFDLTGEKKYILAGRGRIASVLSGDLDVVSANRRLFSGGGGSVRGYRERFIGPLDANDDPVGGLSAVEMGVELRARVASAVGIAAFVEAGSVSTSVAPEFDEGVQVAAGLGARYFSPIGPLRLDVGVPLNPRGADDSFQVYISIGQAF